MVLEKSNGAFIRARRRSRVNEISAVSQWMRQTVRRPHKSYVFDITSRRVQGVMGGMGEQAYGA